MSMNETASGQRTHIAFFGRRNAGKSSLVNAITNQSLSVVSDVAGTTTDLVKKAMEILPLGPVVIIDTPGLDDEGMLGELRVKKAREALSLADIAVLVVDAGAGMGEYENKILDMFKERKLPYAVVMNKKDIAGKEGSDAPEGAIWVSALTGEGINELREMLGQMAPKNSADKLIVGDLINRGDTVILVIPIDSSAPKGRIILPQQNVLRELLDINCKTFVCQDTELADTLGALKEPPALVITDSQAFGKVQKIVPREIPLTSFSILFARYKGTLEALVEGSRVLKALKDGDKVLIAEGCTHHRQCEDIGTVKIPMWIDKLVGAKPDFEWSSGTEFPEDLSRFRLIIHCGACVMTETQMKSRLERAKEVGVPVVNYGIAIAAMHGILDRSLEPVMK
ncbi:MAG: [FeFe] hydrogenase H-cluster maturation GTPase HydF [Anaerovoracaceae bacterium]